MTIRILTYFTMAVLICPFAILWIVGTWLAGTLAGWWDGMMDPGWKEPERD